MEKKITRHMIMEKENDRKHVNKRENNYETTSKMDRLLLIKKISNGEERENMELKLIRNSKEVRAYSKSLTERTEKIELKPLSQPATNTQQFCKLYAQDIIQHSGEDFSMLGSFLISHDIDKNLRARMLDWMIEVTSSYKFTPKTYFASVYLMDRYFKAEEQRLPITRLHIIGVVAMLIATKMDEVYPLKIKTVYDKIVHKKIEKKQLVQMQARMTQKLGFTLNVWSFYDLAMLKLHETCLIKNEQVLRSFQEICQYIAKFVVFNYELYGHNTTMVLAQSLLRAASKIYGSEKSRMIFGDRFGMVPSEEEQLCIELILDTVRSFKTNFRSLNNIFKYSENGILAKVQEYFKN